MKVTLNLTFETDIADFIEDECLTKKSMKEFYKNPALYMVNAYWGDGLIGWYGERKVQVELDDGQSFTAIGKN